MKYKTQNPRTLHTIRHFGIALLWLFLLHLNACKEEETFPEETQHGANTFACKINGVEWLPRGDDNLQPYLEPNGGLFSIGALDRGNSSFTIGIKELTGTGIYPVFFTTENRDTTILIPDITFSFNDWKNSCFYKRLTPDIYIEGFIEITKYDMTNYIVAGKFEATMKTPNCETLHITEGRFDFQFK